MSYTITESQIKEAHKSACSDWKKKIESWFPDVFKSKLEVGKWCKYNNRNSKENGYIFIESVTNIQGERLGYGCNIHGEWIVNMRYYSYCAYTLATDTEVSEMLIKEAKKRGFVDGVRINNTSIGYAAEKGLLATNYFEFIPVYNLLKIDGWNIFQKGKWATIVEQPKEHTLSEIEEKLGYKIKIVA